MELPIFDYGVSSECLRPDLKGVQYHSIFIDIDIENKDKNTRLDRLEDLCNLLDELIHYGYGDFAIFETMNGFHAVSIYAFREQFKNIPAIDKLEKYDFVDDGFIRLSRLRGYYTLRFGCDVKFVCWWKKNRREQYFIRDDGVFNYGFYSFLVSVGALKFQPAESLSNDLYNIYKQALIKIIRYTSNKPERNKKLHEVF